VYYQFVHAIKGMGDACRRFNTPVTGGNVSFYNQNPDGPVYPTPTIGMVGLLDSYKDRMTLGFLEAGDLIYLVGKATNDINSSEYLHKIAGVEYSPAPHFELEEEFQLQASLLQLIRAKQIRSAHDISEGGLFITLLESSFVNGLGFTIQTDASIRKDAELFGEGQSRVVVSVKPSQKAAFEALTGNSGFRLLGTVTNGEIGVDGENWGVVTEWKNQYDTVIEKLLAGHESEHALSAL
jgi:phosphoribosylformylglycinamidine synthase